MVVPSAMGVAGGDTAVGHVPEGIEVILLRTWRGASDQREWQQRLHRSRT